jgi:putative ABC transport system permease protein
MRRLIKILRFSGGRFSENLRIAFNILRNNKLRSFLTITGVVIGVITVMLISSIISGIDLAFKKQVESFGTRTINISKFDLGFTRQYGREQRIRKPLLLEDSEALAQLDSVEASIPLLAISANVGRMTTQTGDNTSTRVPIYGTTPEIENSSADVLIEGRWFTKDENELRNDVCIIGNTFKANYFSFQNPIGETLKIGGREFRVIGVLQKRPQLLGDDADSSSNIIYIPMRSALRLQPDATNLSIKVIAREGLMQKTEDQVQDLLRLRRGVSLNEPNNFGMSTAESLIEKFHEVTAGIAIAMVAISSIGLIVGGIGVMNIMLVSVTERTREIGIRKAIGAKKKDILVQFLIESATLTGLGGVIGLTIGWLLTFLVKIFMPSYVPLWAPIVGFTASVSIGIIFGLFPAYKASILDPIEALRYE